MPGSNGLLIVSGPEIGRLLRDLELELLHAVELAYRLHATGDTSVPHSTFLHFPSEPQNRMIALPAYLGGDPKLAGVKWIASFPANYERGLDRASAVIVLNSTDTGIPEVILEGSIISAKRTAASAALAARTLITGAPPSSVGIIGCGLINAEILRFLGALFPLERLVMLDTDLERMSRFRERIRSFLPDIRMSVAAHAAAVFRAASLISIATTASAPHIESIDRPVTILHVSLRDLSVSSILASDNVVDDPDHVCRARTSLHLAEEATGRRDFIRCTLGEILCGKKPARRDEGSVIFSPFGLGILDLAVARLVCDLALRSGVGTRIEGFLPEPWLADRG